MVLKLIVAAGSSRACCTYEMHQGQSRCAAQLAHELLALHTCVCLDMWHAVWVMTLKLRLLWGGGKGEPLF